MWRRPPTRARAPCWCSPAAAARRATKATSPPAPRYSRTWLPLPSTSRRDPAALAPLHGCAPRHHAALRSARARHVPAAAARALPRHLGLVPRGAVPHASSPRHRVESRGPREPPRATGGDPVEAPVGLGNHRLPAHLSAAGVYPEAGAPLDTVFRLGARAD